MRWRQPGLHSKTQSQMIGGGEGREKEEDEEKERVRLKRRRQTKKVTKLYVNGILSSEKKERKKEEIKQEKKF